MSTWPVPEEPTTPAGRRARRDQATGRVRRVTRSLAVLAAVATAVVGMVVAKEYPRCHDIGAERRQPARHYVDDRADDSVDQRFVLVIGDVGRHLVGKHVIGQHRHHHAALDDALGHRRVRRNVVTNGTMTADVVATRTGRALGTNVVLCVTDPGTLDRAHAILRDELVAVDRTCSRFRPDSELHNLHAASGAPVPVSALLFEALVVAYDVARRTGGAVDPTVGGALEALGYDRDFAEIRPSASARAGRPVPAPGWWRVELDPARRTAHVPAGTRIDLGSSAKALAADRAAGRIAAVTGVGVLVGLGGDVAVAGPPPVGGWAVGIAADSSADVATVQQVVAIDSGGVATSSTAVRALSGGGATVHHIVDPATGASVVPYWTLASATGPSCVDANAASTAAIVWAERAVANLRALGQPARLVRSDGRVATVNGWPPEDDTAALRIDPEERGMSSPLLWYVTRATGIVALVLLTATTVLGIVTANRVTTARWPGFALQDLHRRISGIAMAFLALHVVTSVLDAYVHIGWASIVIPFASAYRPFWVALGTVGVDLLIAVAVTSVLRHRIAARTWRAVHWLAYLSWPVALAHAFGMGTDMATSWATALAATCIALVVGAATWRIAVSSRQRRRATQLGAPGRRPSGVAAKHIAA